MNDNGVLKSLTTVALVNELQVREGVAASKAEPYQDITISVNGPATVLIIKD